MLANSYRVETINFTRAGVYDLSLLQGGQRWQSLRLLTNGSIAFKRVGFRASADHTDVQDFPGRFDSSDETLNQIWALGARAAQIACLEAGSQEASWSIDPVKGAHVRTQRPAQTLEGINWANYTLEFDAYIERGGFWWTVGGGEDQIGGNAYNLVLVGNLPKDTTFINHNYTLLPANTLLVSWGADLVNQTTLTSYLLDSFPIPFDVEEGTGHHVSTIVSNDSFSVSVNGKYIAKVSLSSYWGAQDDLVGTIGLGAYQDHAAYYRNVKVSDIATGSVLCDNPMTTEDVLLEYGTHANLRPVCLDGPKRDRLVWLGDFYHTARIIPVSTSRSDLVKGTLQEFLDTQTSSGPVIMAPSMGYEPVGFPPGRSLDDYQIFGLISFHAYVRASNDIEWARSTWPRWQKLASWLLSNVNATDGLIHVDYCLIGGADGGAGPSCAAVSAFNGLADVASVLGDAESETEYRNAATKIAAAVNTRLWNDDLGVYSLQLDSPNDFATSASGLCITSGVATGERVARLTAALESLRLGPGYKDTSLVRSTDPSVNIAPFQNGFLLPGLFQANATSQGGELIRNLWGAMLGGTPELERTFSGASWEYVNSATLQPGLGLFTSLGHPWGGAATYVLTEWVAGVRPAEGTPGFGYGNWVAGPEAGVRLGLGRASATVVTAFDGDLKVAWHVGGDQLSVDIDAPVGTSGRFVYGDVVKELSGATSYGFSIPV